MNCAAEDDTTKFYKNPENNDSESTENFQKFISDLFEKNGVLNDLRAYLRGHIVEVLKSAETGTPLPCQKHFTQRLELVSQALNMLIAEYLLRLEFSYSLSVFVSEIPLANMVFHFARKLMHTADTNISALRFQESDVWSILHYLGIQCDSMHASKIVQSYKDDESPLLHCILKCIPMYQREPICIDDNPTSDISSSVKSTESYEERPNKRTHKSNTLKCKHYAYCKSCQTRILRLKEKYKKRKIKIEKNEKKSSVNSLNVQSLMNNVTVMEKSLIDELFQQVKNVYEAEVEIIREEKDRKIKRSIANHALQLQKCREEMEESFKARQKELERGVQQKKKFLWGLARALREQHEHMALAIKDVHYETKRLEDKESSIKTQLTEAEHFIKRRGEEMRSQISEELITLEGHLETMKRERDSINKERDDLEHLKNTYENNRVLKQHETDETIDFKTHYNTLKDEMVLLRKYIASSKLESKSFIERGTVMDFGEGVMNNSVDVRGDDYDDKLKGSQVVNDLKKQKNVNFSQPNLDEIYRQLSRSNSGQDSAAQVRGSDPDWGPRYVSEPAAKSDHRDTCHACDRDALSKLREENDRLKNFARQQREHIDALSSERERLQADLAINRRPRTAPSVMASHYFSTNRMNPTTSTNAFGSRTGAGEELGLLYSSEPRVLLPGDTVPFIGVLRDRHPDARRHLISTWRALRRLSPHTHPKRGAPQQRGSQESCENAEISISNDATQPASANRSNDITPQTDIRSQQIKRPVNNKPREKSPKSVLREAKEKLKNNVTKEPPAPKDKSPNAVLREAKMRLRKLEIEAEAVEKSYLDFKKRQSELREERQNLVLAESTMLKSVSQLEHKTSTTIPRIKTTENIPLNGTFNYEKSQENLKKDFDKYLREYQTKFDIGQIHYQNKNSVVQRIKPIPPPYAEICEEAKVKNENYLETPLTEFRKLYQTQNTKRRENSNENPNLQHNYDINSQSFTLNHIEKPESDKSNELKIIKDKQEFIRKVRNNEKKELEILKQNIKKIYPETSTPNKTELDIAENIVNNTEMECLDEDMQDDVAVKENQLTLQVEHVRETNNVGVTESKQDLLLVVESSVDNRETDSSENENEEPKISTQMTIIVSPKGDNTPTKPKSPSRDVMKNLDKLTNKDALNAIFHAENDKELSSVDMQLELTKEHIESEVEKDQQEEYIDDFSADVDNYYNNYNSMSDGGKNSPISLPKTSEDDNFWDN